MSSQVVLNVEGMSCMHCVGRVEKALTGVAGVEKAEVVLDAGQASISGAELDPEALVKAVVEAGYKAAQA